MKRISFALLLFLLLVGCKNTILVESVSLDPEEMTLVLGEKATVQYTLQPRNASLPYVEWFVSEGEEFVSVSKTGDVKALKVGSAVVTARALDEGRRSRTMKVAVIEKQEVVPPVVPVVPVVPTEPSETPSEILVQDISFPLNRSTILLSETYQQQPLLSPENATDKTLSWSVEQDTPIVNIDENGVVTPLGSTVGSVKVIATTANGVKSSFILSVGCLSESSLYTVLESCVTPKTTFEKTEEGYILLNEANIAKMNETIFLKIDKRGVSDLGILRFFPKLQVLTCSGNQLTQIDVSCCPKIMYLYCDGNHIQTVDVTSLTEILMVACGNQTTKDGEVLQCTLIIKNDQKSSMLSDSLSVEENRHIDIRIID